MLSPRQFVLLAVVGVGVLLLPFYLGYNFTAIRESTLDLLHLQRDTTRRHLHVMLPVTSTDSHLCRLLISAGITGYPDPVFVGWNGSGIYNGKNTHLFKITETLAYLDALPQSSDEDLFLMLDAFDIILQLRVDVLISRYFRLLEKSNERLRQQGLLGKVHRGSVIEHTVVIGADKQCAPQTGNQAACWAVPQSPLSETFYGEHTDTSPFTNRGRWLNSGTIMGPVKDVRDMFRATFDMMGWQYAEGGSSTSDQYYFAEVWAEQEVERIRFRDGNESALTFDEKSNRIVPNPIAGKRTEYHMTLDYETDIFQTASGYDRAITWMSYNHSIPLPSKAAQRLTTRMDEWTLPADVLAGDPPFKVIEYLHQTPEGAGWSDVMLGTQVMKPGPFPLIHVTGAKWLRDRWWKKMWFHPFAEELLIATKRKRHLSAEPDVLAVVDGVKWHDWQRFDLDGSYKHDTEAEKIKGGAWTGHGQFLPFADLCGKFEDSLYNTG